MTAPSTTAIELIDLKAQRDRIGPGMDAAIDRVLQHGKFIMGPEVGELEARLARYCGVGHAVTCSSGTDALLMTLLALGIETGDAVFVPTFTFAATAEVVALVGATPIFVDVLPDTFNLDPGDLQRALEMVQRSGLRPRAVIAVDIFGQPADYDAIGHFCDEHSLTLIADAAQSFGATWRGRRTGSIGAVACTSFFPAKPLGCYGDGGAIFTDDASLAATLRSVRVHGQGTDKYDNVRIGLNGRLDTLQAAVLLEKLTIFDEELDARRRVATRYAELLGDVVDVPYVRSEATSSWAQFTVQAEGRDALAAGLRERGVPTAVYYAIPLHRQPAYQHLFESQVLPVADRLAGRVLSLPMHPYLDEATQDRISTAFHDLRP